MAVLLYRIAIFCLLILSLPLQIVVAVLIVVTSGFGVLFRQKRIGIDGKPFIIVKFRTMRRGAESLQRKYGKLNESLGPAFKIYNDPRFTRIGKFLSHTGLDELPQLYNVLRGDMALIGPRPLPVAEAAKLALWMRERHRVLPGIISPAILTDSYHQNFGAWMKSDVAYAMSKSVWADAVLLVRFIPFITKLLLRGIFSR